METFYVVPESEHNALVAAAFLHRGFSEQESNDAARFAAQATRHGVRTHNAIKALHLDELFGSFKQGCVPGAEIEKKPSRFAASEIWDAHLKMGQATAYAAMDRAMELADQYGVGMISIDNAFHYLWGGGYVMEVAKKGYIAYTNCVAAQTEVVPFKGVYPTLGTNPHSWGLPTTDAIGFPIVIDWATSVISMGRVQQFEREGQPLPPNAAIDSEGNITTDPKKVAALTPFGAHKGYSLCLMNELIAAYIGGGLPTVRGRWADDGEKHAPCFFFQVWHPDAMNAGAFAKGRSQQENVKAVLDDILGHGNEQCMLPGQMEAEAARRSEANGGLLFSQKEIESLNAYATECGHPQLELSRYPQAK